MISTHKLVLGPVLFNWDKEKLLEFYQMIAKQPHVEAVCIGEVICAKREKFGYQYWADLIELLLDSGKQVRFSTLSVISNDYELRVIRQICESELMHSGRDIQVEANDMSTLSMLGNASFSIGQLFNCYNESTVKYLARKGAQSITLPVELSIEAIRALAHQAPVPIGVQVFGRMPLALSVRCYQARAYGLNKQNCEIICKNDLDGLVVNTLEDKPLFAVNGLQTLSNSYCNLIANVDLLKQAGVSEFRVSPQDNLNMVEVFDLFSRVINNQLDADEASQTVKQLFPNQSFSNGYLFNQPGMEMIPMQNLIRP